MNRRVTLLRLLFVLQISAIVAFSPGHALAQQKSKDDVPKTQIPVEERDNGDSIIETIGELPGELVALPFKLFFTGVSKVAKVVDYNTIVLRVTDWLTNEDGTRKVRPIFTPVSGGGLVFIQDDLFRSGMRFRGMGSFGARTRRNFYGGIRDLQFFSPKLGFKLEGFYRRLPDEDFWGIGIDSQEEDETNYLHEESNLRIELLSNAFERVVFGAGFSFSDVNIKDGRSSGTLSTLDPNSGFTEAQVPGLLGAEMGTFVFEIYRDSRNRSANPTAGGEELLSYEHSREIGGSDFGYNKFTADLRRYLHLFNERVLALRVRTEVTDPFGNRDIPFFRLSGLGGREVLRGFRRTRFRDQDLALFGAEYRFPVHHLMDALFFGEEARVFSDIFDEFSLDDFKYSVGGGLRLRSRGGNLIALLEIAKSEEDLRVYFELNKGLRSF